MCCVTAAALFGSGEMNRLWAVIRYTAESMCSGAKPAGRGKREGVQGRRVRVRERQRRTSSGGNQGETRETCQMWRGESWQWRVSVYKWLSCFIVTGVFLWKWRALLLLVIKKTVATKLKPRCGTFITVLEEKLNHKTITMFVKRSVNVFSFSSIYSIRRGTFRVGLISARVWHRVFPWGSTPKI